LTFARLRPADWVVFVAALALLFTTAFDWYSTVAGDEARRVQQEARPEEGQPSGQSQAEVERTAGALAESKEKNAWQVDGTIDRVILVCLLLTAALGVLAGFWRASGREARGPGPYGLAGLVACVTALLVLYRIIQEPGFDELTTVKIGAPLALGVLGVYAFAAASSVREEGGVVARGTEAGGSPGGMGEKGAV
jgi:peptidoglycan/LPS O-acetylase OafA/YrhL